MSLIASKHADEIREMWQSRALRESHGRLRKVLIIALAKEYTTNVLVVLAKVTFPGFTDFSRPILISYAHIGLDGRVLAEIVERDGTRHLQPVYDSENQFIYEMRKLADYLKLNDGDRVEMFTVLQKWVASDKRVGTFGHRLAS